jgi:tetratricopeptide (TPR) repeat protein
MKKIIWGILLAFLLPISAIRAQNQFVIDSLQNQLEKVKGKDKAKVLNGLASEFISFKADKSLSLAVEAYNLADKHEDDNGKADSQYFQGLALFQKKDYSHSLGQLLQSLALYEKLGNKKGKGTALVKIGELYKLRNDYKQALDKFGRSHEIFEEIEDKAGMAIALGQMADVNFRLNRFQEALEYAEKSLNMAQEVNPDSKTNETARESCKILAEAHSNLKNFEEAYNYQSIYLSINDSIRKHRETLALDLQTKKYENEARDREEKHKAEIRKKIEKEEKEFRDTIQYSLIVLIFILLFGGILFFMGKFDVSQNMIDTMIFLSVLLLSRFFIVLIMPYASSLGADAPLVTLGANFLLALLFAPLQKYLERKLKKKVAEDLAEETEKDQLREQVKQLSEQIEQNKQDQIQKHEQEALQKN